MEVLEAVLEAGGWKVLREAAGNLVLDINPVLLEFAVERISVSFITKSPSQSLAGLQLPSSNGHF